MSNVHRLRLTDRIFFVNVNLRPRIRRFRDSEYPLILNVMDASRQRLGFLLCGYVLMPDHWHALIWAQYPLLISQAGSKQVGEEPTVSVFLTVL
jgi:REP element-mobilizing transposase RayT